MLLRSRSQYYTYIALAAVATSGFYYYYYYYSNSRDKQHQEKELTKKKETKNNDNTNPTTTNMDIYPTHIRREIMKEERRQAKIPWFSRKTPMYDNIVMIHNGKVLCSISKKKAKWYVSKKLAKWVIEPSDETIMEESKENTKQNDDKEQLVENGAGGCIEILFEPKGGPSKEVAASDNADDNASASTTTSSIYQYNTTIKSNACVVCGKDGYIIRHYIVPYVYRTLFPKKYKSHQSHDVSILCPDCHLVCEKFTQSRMKELEDEILREEQQEQGFDNSINTYDKFLPDRYAHHVRSCALALTRWKSKLPKERIVEYETLLCQHFEVDSADQLTQEQYQEACNLQHKTLNPNYVPIPERIVKKLLADKDDDTPLEDFIKDWREYFITTMEPKFLPGGWDIDNPIQRDR